MHKTFLPSLLVAQIALIVLATLCSVAFLSSPSGAAGTDGLRDEGLGFHADGTARKAGQAGGASAASGSGDFSGQRAATYALSGLDDARLPWLYDSYAGLERDREGRAFDMGSEYSALRAKTAANNASGGGFGFTNKGGSGTRGIFDSVLQRGLSAGMSFANASMESALLGLMGGLMGGMTGKDSPYGNGKARFSFYLSADGRSPARLQGEGDVLWPLYDSLHTTIYTQFGARSQFAGSGGGSEYGPDHPDRPLRWIGNIGMGQRWFPGAKIVEAGRMSAAPQESAAEPAEDHALGRSGASDSSSPTGRGGERHLGEDGTMDSGNWMLGYNAFYDHDLSRGHQRGGVGVEAQYDWLKLATNWYLPISDWKDSTDFDGNFVQERAAQGWDFRVKGYLPFYREVVVTGSFTQWYGQNVGMFGPSKLEKDPRMWSYGLEYTPVPAMTAYVNQRQSERGRSDTEFGLRFTYSFGMGAEEQFKPSRVAEMRTVHGSRHDFVDRENKIILEYRAKNTFHMKFAGRKGNVFTFRIRNGLNKYVAGQVVRVQGNNVTTLAAVKDRSLIAQALDRVGEFLVRTGHAANLSQSYVTDSKGEIHVTVTGLTNTSTLILFAGNTSRTFTAAQLGGGDNSYTFDLSALTVNATSGELSGSITINNADNSPASGVEVTLSYRTSNGTSTTTATSTDISLGSTNTSGQVSVSGNVTALVRNIQFSANGYSTSVIKPVGTMPSGFLTGQSSIKMNWNDAKAYCASHGGKLPLIEGSTILATVNAGASVDGFDREGGVWPSAFPKDSYWTGTERYSTHSWTIRSHLNTVFVTSPYKTADAYAACVP